MDTSTLNQASKFISLNISHDNAFITLMHITGSYFLSTYYRTTLQPHGFAIFDLAGNTYEVLRQNTISISGGY